MKTELYNRNTSSFTAVASAGITMRYRFSAKWSAYAESDFAYYNFERKYSTISLKNGAKSIGLNYNFTWKREKQEVLKSNQIEQL
ncbi:hypothetical protein [Pontibacter fetidus]|uniref:Outer membrane protein beta-barrel domain-containing protein n=1 Tax=Pontibacter fetidus TaxID=2700082 RepID=A0A6B2H6D8_9BACT|nr:hypothetical protein [Pontibacter fetidus]NDK54762.1 hypothetical protein [Pontibacter fetidus]